MKSSRESKVKGRGPESSARCAGHSGARPVSGFTLIEIMVVVGIMGIILAIGIPSIYKLLRKEGMRKATSDVVDICCRARAQAILHGTPMSVVFHPRERRLEVGDWSGSGQTRPADEGQRGGEVPPPAAGSDSGAQIDEDITIEMLDINLSEYRESEWARVRFYPNGTCDEMTLILRSSKNEWKKITLEVTTGMASVDNVQ